MDYNGTKAGAFSQGLVATWQKRTLQSRGERMFEKMVSLPSEGGKSAIKAEISTLKAKLTVQQQQIKQAKLPVVVLLEGWGAAGKGSLLSDIILNIDPRSFNVFSINPPTDEESRRPFLWRYVD